jgi:hypothetical protein
MVMVRATGAERLEFVTVTVTRVKSFFGQPDGLLHVEVADLSRTTTVCRLKPDSGTSLLLNVVVRVL